MLGSYISDNVKKTGLIAGKPLELVDTKQI